MRRREVWNSTIWSLVKRWENSNRWTRWRCLSDFLLLQVIWHPWRVALEFYADFSSVNFDPLKLVRSFHRTSEPSIEASSINSIAPSPFLYWITIRKMAKISFLNQISMKNFKMGEEIISPKQVYPQLILKWIAEWRITTQTSSRFPLLAQIFPNKFHHLQKQKAKSNSCWRK